MSSADTGRSRPPPGEYTAEDLDRIPGLPPHTELIDGGLVFESPQRAFHDLVLRALVNGLDRTVPAHLRVRREMTITIDRHQRPEPDLLVVEESAVTGLSQTTFKAPDVVLAAEVVSPDSEARDRKRKPLLYAEAGIPHFWRMEHVNDQTVVYVYEIDPATNTYALTGVHRDRITLSVPFDIDVDLTEIHRL